MNWYVINVHWVAPPRERQMVGGAWAEDPRAAYDRFNQLATARGLDIPKPEDCQELTILVNAALPEWAGRLW